MDKILEAIRTGLYNEINTIVEEEIKQAQLRVKKRILEAAYSIPSEVMEHLNIATNTHQIIIDFDECALHLNSNLIKDIKDEI